MANPDPLPATDQLVSDESLIEMMPAPALLLDGNGKILRCSDALCELLGLERGGCGPWEPMADRCDEAELNRLRSCAVSCLNENRDAAVVIEVRDAAGEPRPVEWSLRPCPKTGRVAGVGTDQSTAIPDEISEAQSDSDIRRELGMHKAALDEHSIVAITDPAGRIRYANDKFCEISMYDREELLGQDHRILNSGHHPPEFFVELWRTIQNGEVFRAEIRNRAKDGSFYWVDTTIVPFVDESGRITQFVAIRTDITEQKRMNERMMQSSKFAALGELAANIAHEVNNPIGIISGKARLLLTRHRDDLAEKPATEIEKIVQQCDRLADLTKRMLDYSRPNPSARMRIDLHQPLQRALDFVAHRSKTLGVEVESELVSGRADVVANGNELEQVFLNLFLNAMDAMSDGGHLRVATEIEHRPGDSVVVATVEDTGKGVDDSIRHRIFDPFFTTKSSEGGTGLGLAISYGIVRSHDGTIELEAKPGAGTRFRIAFPQWGTTHKETEG